jgi:hypothetical protein
LKGDPDLRRLRRFAFQPALLKSFQGVFEYPLRASGPSEHVKE